MNEKPSAAISHFIVTDRKTDYLLPPSVDDWLNEDHLARFVVEVIDGLDITHLTRQYAGRGSKAHHPATLLAILVYGYASGVFSSRRLEQATYDSVAFRYIAAGTHPATTHWPASAAVSWTNWRNYLCKCWNWPGK